MKKHHIIIPLVLCFLLFSNNILAQISVKESTENTGNGSHNALSVLIHEANDKLITKNFKDLLKKYKGKVSIKKYIFSDDTEIPSISANTIDIYARLEPSGAGTRLIVGFDLGGLYLNSHEHQNQFNSAKKILHDFAVNVTKDAIKEELKTSEKELDKNIKSGEVLVKENERLHKDIEKYKSLIIQAKEDIVINLKDQESNKKTVATQKTLLESIKQKQFNVK